MVKSNLSLKVCFILFYFLKILKKPFGDKESELDSDQGKL